MTFHTKFFAQRMAILRDRFIAMSILFSMLPAAAYGHCSPIQVALQQNALVVSGGLADPLGFAPQLILNGDSGCGFEPAPNNRFVTDVPGFSLEGLQANSGLALSPVLRTASAGGDQATRGLWYWDPATEAVALNAFEQPLRLRSHRGFGELQLYQDDMLSGNQLTIAEPLATDIGRHGHFVRYQFDDAIDLPAGAYGFFARLTSDSYTSSEPFLVVLNTGLSSERLAEAALAINFAAGGGDFSGDGSLTTDDLDALITAVATNTSESRFDLTGDGLVTLADRDAWLRKAGQLHLPTHQPYLPADVNLDGWVDGHDFNVMNAHKFADAAGWSHGDVNADGRVDGADFDVWNTWKFMSSYSEGPAAAVPEPGGPTLCAMIVVCMGWLWRSAPLLHGGRTWARRLPKKPLTYAEKV